MNMQTLIARVRSIILKPKETWPEIAAEPDSFSGIYRNYVLIIAAIPVLCMFVGTALFGIRVPMMGTIRIGFGTLLIQALLSYGVSLLMVYVMTLIIEALAPSFGAVKDRLQSLKTIAYAVTPIWVVGVLHILPGLGVLASLAGLAAAVYAFYLIKLGLPHTVKCPQEKSMGYTAAVAGIGVVLSLVLSFVVGAMSGTGSYMGAMSQRSDTAQFDKDSPMGKLETWSKQMEAAGERMEAAQQSSDSKTQQEAMQNMVGTLLGADPSVKATSPDKLGDFLPEELMGMERSNFSAERNQAMGVQVSQTQASYSDGRQQLLVQIIDMGSAKGILALAGFVAVGTERKTEHGYEKTYSDGGRLVSEKWNDKDNHGEYSTVVGKRFLIKITGQADSITTLRALANSVDDKDLEKLADASSGAN